MKGKEGRGEVFCISPQPSADGHLKDLTLQGVGIVCALWPDLRDLSGRLMKPLCPQRDSSITSVPTAHKYLSHQTKGRAHHSYVLCKSKGKRVAECVSQAFCMIVYVVERNIVREIVIESDLEREKLKGCDRERAERTEKE